MVWMLVLFLKEKKKRMGRKLEWKLEKMAQEVAKVDTGHTSSDIVWSILCTHLKMPRNGGNCPAACWSQGQGWRVGFPFASRWWLRWQLTYFLSMQPAYGSFCHSSLSLKTGQGSLQSVANTCPQIVLLALPSSWFLLCSPVSITGL